MATRLLRAMNARMLGRSRPGVLGFDDPDEAGWIVARIVEVPGALSQGKTREETRENVLDALQVVFAADDDDASVQAGRSEPLDVTVTR